MLGGRKFLQYSKRGVELSRDIQNALLNRSLCILCTPGHRWWNKRLWLYFSSSAVICMFMRFQKRKEKNHVIYTFIYPCKDKHFFFEPWLVAKIIHAYIILSIEGFQCDLFWGGGLASLVAALIQEYQTMCHEALRACRVVPIKHSARWFCRLVPLVWLISKITWKHAHS